MFARIPVHLARGLGSPRLRAAVLSVAGAGAAVLAGEVLATEAFRRAGPPLLAVSFALGLIGGLAMLQMMVGGLLDLVAEDRRRGRLAIIGTGAFAALAVAVFHAHPLIDRDARLLLGLAIGGGLLWLAQTAWHLVHRAPATGAQR